MRYVILLNGISQHGKNTFAEYVGDILKNTPSMGFDFQHISSRDIATKACSVVGDVIEGFDIEERNDLQRKFLSDMKLLLDSYYNVSKRYLYNTVDKSKNTFTIYHVREKQNIEDIKDYYRNFENLKCVSVSVRDPRKKHIPDNMADIDASDTNFEYDFIVENDAGLPELYSQSLDFVDNLINGKIWKW